MCQSHCTVYHRNGPIGHILASDFCAFAGLVSDGVDAIGDEHSPCRRVWPEVVGMNAEAAKKKIKEDVPMVEVRVIPFRSIICDDMYNPRRVRLFMDSSSKVMRPPKIG